MAEAVIPGKDRGNNDLLKKTEGPSSQHPENPWESKLRTQGIPLDVAPRFLDIPQYAGTHIDRLTGLPVEEGELETKIQEELMRCIREGKNWAVIYGDVDNLKTANTVHGKSLGDMVIRFGPAQLTQAIDHIEFSEKTSIYVTRETGAADESVIWLFDLDDDHEEQVKTAIQNATEDVKVVDIDEKGNRFRFSQSAVVFTQHTEEIAEDIADIISLSAESTDRIAYRSIHNIKEKAESAVIELKIAKDLQRMPKDKLTEAERSEEVIRILEDALGDKRSSRELIRKVLIVNAGVARIDTSRAIREVWEDQSINDEERKRKMDTLLNWLDLGIDLESSSNGAKNLISLFVDTIIPDP